MLQALLAVSTTELLCKQKTEKEKGSFFFESWQVVANMFGTLHGGGSHIVDSLSLSVSLSLCHSLSLSLPLPLYAV